MPFRSKSSTRCSDSSSSTCSEYLRGRSFPAASGPKSFYHRAGLGVQDHLAGTLQRLLYFGRVATHHAGKYICFTEHDNALAAGFALVAGAVGVARSHNKQVARFQVPLALVDSVGAGAAFQVKKFRNKCGCARKTCGTPGRAEHALHKHQQFAAPILPPCGSWSRSPSVRVRDSLAKTSFHKVVTFSIVHKLAKIGLCIMDIYNTLFFGKVKKTVFCSKNCIFF